MNKGCNTPKNNLFKKLGSKWLLKEIFDNLQNNKSLEIIKYNKNIQERLEIGINDYKNEYLKTEIEIFPKKYRGKKQIKIINIPNEVSKSHYHIYFNNNLTETKKTYFTGSDNISKIRIILDNEFNSFNGLFFYCRHIEKINFKKFNRKDIIDMSEMFSFCSILKEINFNNFNTNNVKYMNSMFFKCVSLEKLDLSNFNTNNVTTMRRMFHYCKSLKELNLSNFNTNNVVDMSYMFCDCRSLKELNLSNFNTNKLKDIGLMFCGCSSLEELNLSNFNTNNVTSMIGPFSGCSSEFLKKIRNQYKNISYKAFE